MDKRVRAVRADASVRRGLTIILRRLVLDFDNAFDEWVPELSEEEVTDLCAAMEWLEPRANDVYE